MEQKRQDTASSEKDDINPLVVYIIAAVSVLAALYFCRFWSRDLLLFGDEFHGIWNLNKPYSELIKLYDKFGTGVAFLFCQRLCVDTFGPGLFAYRFVAALGAILSVLIVYPVARRLTGRVPALITAAALAANSMHIFYSHFARAYSLAVFLSLLFVYAVDRVLERERPGVLWYVILTVSAALLGWVHLTAVVFVAAVAVAGAGVMVINKGSRRHWYWFAGSFAIAAVICLLLYLPAWRPLYDFVGMKYGQGRIAESGIPDVFALLAGSHLAGWVFLFSVAVSAIWFLAARGPAALLPVTAAFVPVAGILVTRPAGNVYAYARYLLIALPFMLMLTAWLLVKLLSLLHLRGKLGSYLSPAAGLLLVVLSFVAGPLGLRHTADGPFANTYLSMMPLPAFDVPWDQTPGFYKDLAKSNEQVRIIEAPELLSDSTLLYRNYYLRHRKKVTIGLVTHLVGSENVNLPVGPYIDLSEPDWAERCDADYLVLHRDVVKEIFAYWKFVYNKVWPNMREQNLRSMMAKHYSIVRPVGSLSKLVERFGDELGEPVYEDSLIVVWKLASK